MKEKLFPIALVLALILFTVFFSWALVVGQNECEAKGGEWKNYPAGKVVIVVCEE